MADLFSGIYPTGIVYADKDIQSGGDYHKVAFLSFQTLELKVYDKSSRLLPQVEADAAKIIGRKGESFDTSACGQPITLGYGLKD